MIRTLPVDIGRFGEVRYAGTKPKLDTEGIQRQNYDGQNQHVVSIAITVDGTLETLAVTVPEPTLGTLPGAGIDMFSSCTIEGLRAGFYVNDRGTGNWYYQADAVAPAAPTSPAVPTSRPVKSVPSESDK